MKAVEFFVRVEESLQRNKVGGLNGVKGFVGEMEGLFYEWAGLDEDEERVEIDGEGNICLRSS